MKTEQQPFCDKDKVKDIKVWKTIISNRQAILALAAQRAQKRHQAFSN